MSVSNNIRTLLQARNIKVKGLAVYLGIQEQSLHNKFARDSFTADELAAIAEFAGVKLAFLLNDDEKILIKRGKLMILNTLIKEAEETIQDKIKSHFDGIDTTLDDDSMAVDLEVVDGPDVQNIKQNKIVSVEKQRATISYEVECYTEIQYLDAGSWHSDGEGGVFFTESVSATINDSVEVEVAVCFDVPIDDIDVDDYEICDDDITILSPKALSLNASKMENITSENGLYSH